MISLIILILILGVVAYFINVAPAVDGLFKQIAIFVLAIIAIVAVLNYFGVVGSTLIR